MMRTARKVEAGYKAESSSPKCRQISSKTAAGRGVRSDLPCMSTLVITTSHHLSLALRPAAGPRFADDNLELKLAKATLLVKSGPLHTKGNDKRWTTKELSPGSQHFSPPI